MNLGVLFLTHNINSAEKIMKKLSRNTGGGTSKWEFVYQDEVSYDCFNQKSLSSFKKFQISSTERVGELFDHPNGTQNHFLLSEYPVAREQYWLLKMKDKQPGEYWAVK